MFRDINPRPLRTLVTGAAVILGGIVTLNLASTVTLKALHLVSENKRKKVALPCMACRGKGFYICKLCKGNSTIEWSPFYDPVAINPCLCPTCEGNGLDLLFSMLCEDSYSYFELWGVQRCLNCLGKGYD